MGNSIIVLIAVGGGVACMALAWWLWKRDQPTAPSIAAEQRDLQDEHGTVVIPKDDLFSDQTVFLDQESAARAVAPDSPSPRPEAATKYVPRQEIFRVADRVQATTQSQPPPTASEDAPVERTKQLPKRPPAGTEFISQDEVMAIIESSRAK